MHELSICIAMLDEVERIAQARNSAAVSRILLKIGPLSGVEPHLLRNAWPLAAAGSVAENADLVIETADIVVQCSQCNGESAASANRLLCAQCGDYRTRVISGDELILQQLELQAQTDTSSLRPS